MMMRCGVQLRQHVVGELYETERSYVESLQILVEKYMKPLKNLENRSLIESSLVGEIFYTIPEILQHHERFLQALQDRISSDWDSSQVIGNVFIEAFTNQQIIDTYTAFINNWKNARQAIKIATQAKPAFERFLEAMSREHRNKLTLDALLIMPVQRIPRYELLIKELIKHTPEDHPDHGPLIEAQKEIHELALKIDQAEKEMIHQEQLRELESLFDGHIELQHPQRDFIRYDLVTILGSTALTLTKKERVIFLFCDLLVMTSVKKKASRRTNLHSAFINSYNDISLLEGSKFKLLLRASLDQVDIRLASDKLESEEQQIASGLSFQQGKMIHDKKSQIESDLQLLHQIESMSSKLALVDRSRICEITEELASQLCLVMRDLDRCDVQAFSHTSNPSAQQTTTTNQASSESPSKSTSTQVNAGQTNLNSLSDSNVSLELIITSTNCSDKDNNAGPGLTSMDLNTGDQARTDLHSAMSNPQLPGNIETLVVNFTSTDRRHAFLQSFLGAKQQRKQVQRNQNYQKNKIFSSTLTLKLAQPGTAKQRSFSYDPRKRRHLQHQERLESRSVSNSQIGHQATHANNKSHGEDDDHNSSFPICQHSTPNMIVHQMSAPQFLQTSSSGAGSRCELSQCLTCSTEDSMQSCHHHHQQLMHQPASQPASLDTICCHDSHDSQSNLDSAQKKQSRSDNLIEICNVANIIGARNNVKDESGGFTSMSESNPKKFPLVDHLELSLLTRSGPRFFASLPVNFLATQHPALQFTCLAPHNDSQTEFIRNLRDSTYPLDDRRPSPLVRDESTKVWLCLSNGYVSHVVLMALKRNMIKKGHEPLARLIDGSKYSEFSYEIIPIIQSAGDVCKAHINCATQVKHTSLSGLKKETAQLRKLKSNQKELIEPENPGVDLKKAETTDLEAPCVEVAINSASPPIDVQARGNPLSGSSKNHLSESAPTHCSQIKDRPEPRVTVSSLSAPRLEVPFSPGKYITKQDQKLGGLKPNRSINEDRTALHNAICHRHYHHNREETQRFRNRLNPKASLQQGGDTTQKRTSERSLDGGSSLHQIHTHKHQLHYQSYSYQHINQGHRAYLGSRHNTVPLNELRHALERQNKLKDLVSLGGSKLNQLAPPSNTPNSLSGSPQNHRQLNSLDLASHNLKNVDAPPERRVRSATPPAGYNGMKSFKSARLLRHQASLRTSSILAKLVGSKRSLKNKQGSDVEDTDVDPDKSKTDLFKQETRSDETLSNEKITSHSNSLTTERCLLGSRENTVVSPLSSVSSLNSTNSSVTVNSICTSSPNRSCHDLLPGSCTIYAPGSKFISNPCCSSLTTNEAQGIRERSATMPSQAISLLTYGKDDVERLCLDPRSKSSCGYFEDRYKVSEIVEPLETADQKDSRSRDEVFDNDADGSSVWFGCDDGSIIIIDCLTNGRGSTCQLCDSSSKSFNCNNHHSEIKLSASVSDIRNCNEERIFVALTNGQLAIFSRTDYDCDTKSVGTGWSLTDPKILSVANNELNFISKLCLINETYLWYSYGKSIYVLNTKTLTSEATIKVPTNDVSLQMTMQSIMIDNMVLVETLQGVWVSFKNSYLIQFYAVKSHKILIEVNLLDPINKILSFSNEILRQHKTACLKATTVLSYDNQKEDCTTIFIGTSAGIILYLVISQDQLAHWINQDNPSKDWQPQVTSLRHGHSGHVKFLHLVHARREKKDIQHSSEGSSISSEDVVDREELDTFLVSGGTGLDFYGPHDCQQSFYRLNAEEDNLNHMLLWKL